MHLVTSAKAMFSWVFVRLLATFVKTLVNTVKPVFFRVPFISQISQAWQVRENNRPQKFEYSSVSCSRKQKRQNYGVQNN